MPGRHCGTAFPSPCPGVAPGACGAPLVPVSSVSIVCVCVFFLVVRHTHTQHIKPDILRVNRCFFMCNLREAPVPLHAHTHIHMCLYRWHLLHFSNLYPYCPSTLSLFLSRSLALSLALSLSRSLARSRSRSRSRPRPRSCSRSRSLALALSLSQKVVLAGDTSNLYPYLLSTMHISILYRSIIYYVYIYTSCRHLYPSLSSTMYL